MKYFIPAFFCFVFIIANAQEIDSKTQSCFPKAKIIGREEMVFLPKLNLQLPARVDSGAESSSLHGTNLKIQKVGKKIFLEYTIFGADNTPTRRKSLVIRSIKIKSASKKGASFRYVIEEQICLGNLNKEVKINIADRSEMKFKFLIGRDILAEDFLVDVSKSNLLDTRECSK